MDSRRTYPHFCMMARTLEMLGERWTLLLVRDLLLGPRRFTDLQRTLGGITPKRLTERLRDLHAAGIVEREREEGRREVWYELTPSGRDLESIVDALTLWGIEHALDGPRPGEPVSPDHVMQGSRVWLNTHGEKPSGPVVWLWRFGALGDYTLRFDGVAWALARGGAGDVDLSIEATPDAWARFLTAPPELRTLSHSRIRLTAADPSRHQEFTRAFAGRE
jgi:DNA-binding HxlR family transcriptional regulator